MLTRNEYLTIKDLPAGIRPITEKGILDPYDLQDGYEPKINAFEKEMLLEAIRQSENNQSAAARSLGISERHIRSRLERLGLK